MYRNAQMLEILGWFIINIYFIIPEISLLLPKEIKKITNFYDFFKVFLIVLIRTHFFGFLIGTLLLYFSRDYGYSIFSFIILWIGFLSLHKFASKTKNRLILGIVIGKEFLIVFIFILFGVFYKTEIWFITATLYTILTILMLINSIYFPETTFGTPRRTITNFLPGLTVMLVSILFVFDLGILNSTTLYTFYSALIGGFFALLGVVAMFGIFILGQNKDDYLSKLFKGLIFIYIITILTLVIGLITLPKDSNNEPYLDISHNSLIPDMPLKERQLSCSSQIFGKIAFTASLGLLLSSLAYLYLLISELLKWNPTIK